MSLVPVATMGQHLGCLRKESARVSLAPRQGSHVLWPSWRPPVGEPPAMTSRAGGASFVLCEQIECVRVYFLFARRGKVPVVRTRFNGLVGEEAEPFNGRCPTCGASARQ